jgi:hypothetical protein
MGLLFLILGLVWWFPIGLFILAAFSGVQGISGTAARCEGSRRVSCEVGDCGVGECGGGARSDGRGDCELSGSPVHAEEWDTRD